eukprot:6568184-Alexandrium_andersonii.AAC.1
MGGLAPRFDLFKTSASPIQRVCVAGAAVAWAWWRGHFGMSDRHVFGIPDVPHWPRPHVSSLCAAQRAWRVV